MDISDGYLLENRDWDPLYLSKLFDKEFNNFDDLWISDISDNDLKMEAERVEKYVPIVEDISVDDDELCSAVEKIENQ